MNQVIDRESPDRDNPAAVIAGFVKIAAHCHCEFARIELILSDTSVDPPGRIRAAHATASAMRSFLDEIRDFLKGSLSDPP